MDWGVFIAHIGCKMLLLASYVNDCTVTSSSKELIHSFKAKIGMCFKITDLGPISWLLSMKVTCNRDWCMLSVFQEPFIKAILAKYNFTDMNPLSIPMNSHIQLSTSQFVKSTANIAFMKQVLYCSALGSLMYLAVGTQPDITFAISTLAQFTKNPGLAYWEALEQVYHYLVGMKKWLLTMGWGGRASSDTWMQMAHCRNIITQSQVMLFSLMGELFRGH